MEKQTSRIVVKGEFLIDGIDEADARRELVRVIEQKPFLLDAISVEKV
jgi:hypothetical protein